MASRSLLQSHLLLLLAAVLVATVPVALGEVGTASYYGPPYESTDCYGEGPSQFPESKLFAAVGDMLWDMGAACGREYDVRCIREAQSGPGPCKRGSGTIRIKIVDYALSVNSSAAEPKQSVTGADVVLSQPAFEAIANPSMELINIEYESLVKECQPGVCFFSIEATSSSPSCSRRPSLWPSVIVAQLLIMYLLMKERTDCYRDDSSQFPGSKMFVAVGDKLWYMGAAWGREYDVRCISGAQSGPGPCKLGSGTIWVKIVDYALSVNSSAAAPKQYVTGADLVLSQTTFEAIANPSMV